MARVPGYRTSWEMAGEAAIKYHGTNWRAHQEDYLEKEFRDWWAGPFVVGGKSRTVFDLNPATLGLPEPITRWSVWKILGVNKPHTFRDLEEQSEPPWNDLAAVGIEGWGKGALDYFKEHIGLSESDACDWIRENEPLDRAAESEKPTERRGRKPYDWDNFWREVTRIANTPDGLPEQQADLEKIMLAWCSENWSKKPGLSTVRQKLSPLY